MNWYKRLKMAQMSGEYWITEDGRAEEVSGDTDGLNHENHVRMHLLYQHMGEKAPQHGEWPVSALDPYFVEAYADNNMDEVVNYLTSQGLIPKASTNQDPNLTRDNIIANLSAVDILRMNNVPEDIINVITEQIDARAYGLKMLGWKRVEGSNVETWEAAASDLKAIANGLYEAYGGFAETSEFSLFVHKPGISAWFTGATLDDFVTGKLSTLKNKRFQGW